MDYQVVLVKLLVHLYIVFFYRGHPIVFNSSQGKQIVYNCCQTQQYYI